MTFREMCISRKYEDKYLIPRQLCVVSGYSTGWQAGLENISEEDLIICCTKSRSITQAGSELDFLLRPKATVDTGRWKQANSIILLLYSLGCSPGQPGTSVIISHQFQTYQHQHQSVSGQWTDRGSVGAFAPPGRTQLRWHYKHQEGIIIIRLI